MRKSRSFIAIPPGITIKEQIMDKGMNQKEFALRMGMSEKHISKLMNGDVQLTIDMARRLEMVLGIPAQFWCNLEAIYREMIAKVKEENEIATEIEIAEKMPYDEMVNSGWIEGKDTWIERVVCLRKFFEVARLDLLQSSLIPMIACRKLQESEEYNYPLIAWVQKVKLEARKMDVYEGGISSLGNYISVISKVVKERSEFTVEYLAENLSCHGVALVYLPSVGNYYLQGVTFQEGKRFVIGITVPYEDKKSFLFSLCHEVAHIIYGHVGKEEGTSEEDEKLADEYAKNMCYNIFNN